MPLAGEVRGEVREQVGAVAGEGGEGVGDVEFEAQGGAGHEGAGRDDEQGEFGAFDSALQAIPEWRGDPTQSSQGGVGEIEHHESEVGVAGEEIGYGERGGHVAAAGPDEVFQVGAGVGFGIETLGGINEGDALAAPTGDGEQLTEQEVGAATGRGGNEFGEGGEGQAAAGGIVERTQAGGQARRGIRPLGGGKAFGEEVPKRSQIGGRGGQGGKRERAK